MTQENNKRGVDISDITGSVTAAPTEEGRYVNDNPDELLDYLEQADPAMAMFVKQFTDISNQLNTLHAMVDANTKHLSYLLTKDPEFMLKFNEAQKKHERQDKPEG